MISTLLCAARLLAITEQTTANTINTLMKTIGRIIAIAGNPPEELQAVPY